MASGREAGLRGSLRLMAGFKSACHMPLRRCLDSLRNSLWKVGTVKQTRKLRSAACAPPPLGRTSCSEAVGTALRHSPRFVWRRAHQERPQTPGKVTIRPSLVRYNAAIRSGPLTWWTEMPVTVRVPCPMRSQTVADAATEPSWVTIRAPPGPRHAPHRHQTRRRAIWRTLDLLGDPVVDHLMT